ncbi:MAG: hypothetical protein HY889_07485 [Deltaproteobacteria bacterium]|nr:hypothetical protein [Deltaproteobacteria bacterium]
MESAEEFFSFFAMPYDPSVVRVHRFAILLRFGERKKEIDAVSPSLSDEERFSRYKEALKLAYCETIEGDGAPVIKKPSCSGCSGCSATSALEGFKSIELGE